MPKRRIPTIEVGPRKPLVFVFNTRPLAWERTMPIRVKGHTRMVKTQRCRDYQMRIAEAGSLQYPFDSLLEGDLIVDCVFYMRNRIHGDKDNIEKNILDALQGVVYKNDKQIRGGSQQFVYFDELDEDEEKLEKSVVTIRHRRPLDRLTREQLQGVDFSDLVDECSWCGVAH